MFSPSLTFHTYVSALPLKFLAPSGQNISAGFHAVNVLNALKSISCWILLVFCFPYSSLLDMDLEIGPDELKRLLVLSPDSSQPKAKRIKSESKRSRVGTESQSACASEDKNVSWRSPNENPTGCLPISTPSVEKTLIKEIFKRIAQKNKCTLCVSGLPAKTTISKLSDLVSDEHTVRLKWNTVQHKCSGTAYLEFKTEDLVDKYSVQLNGKHFSGKVLSTKTGQFFPEATDRYDFNTLVLHGLHYKTHTGEIAKRFPSATSIKLSHRGKHSDRNAPVLAHVTFPSAQDALLAFDTRQNCVIRRRHIGLNWLLKQDIPRPSQTSKCLFVRGLKKVVSENDLQTIFPQASSITIHPTSGEAVLRYDLEEDCVLDWQNARNLQLYGRKVHTVLCTSSSRTDTKPRGNYEVKQSEAVKSSSAEKCFSNRAIELEKKTWYILIVANLIELSTLLIRVFHKPRNQTTSQSCEKVKPVKRKQGKYLKEVSSKNSASCEPENVYSHTKKRKLGNLSANRPIIS
ncbi:uncharacterized protein DEA37_0010191 [Paragonimus westermani]|uniref:RRM domain-containing protein n=1 Tax=Paragonimus westermani TaxID=34504 RepID=A0A5J4NIF3_9TREM|nr:uncharacterized protein DEA37_0010191 [Paragonimus westermani]